MATRPHIIGRQLIDLKVDKQADAFRIQEDISWTFRERVIPRLEEMLDQMIDSETLLRLDRLEIDLGRLDPNRLEESFIDQFMAQSRIKLSSEIQGITHKNTEKSATSVSFQGHAWELLIYFLQKGTLPWWGEISSFTTWESQLLESIKSPEQKKKISQLKTLFISNPQAIRRWVYQFSDEFQEAIAIAFFSKKWHSIKEVKIHLEKSIEKIPEWTASTLSASEESWTSIWTHLIQEAEIEVAWKRIIQKILKKWSVDTGISPEILAEKMYRSALAVLKNQKKTGTPFFLTLVSRISREMTAGFLTENYREAPQNVGDAKLESHLPQDEINIQNALAEKSIQQNQIAISEEVGLPKSLDPEEGVFLKNSGLVILHPFFLILFESLELVKDRDFVDEGARHRAIHLMQFAATGEEGLPEYEMALNKLLCGLPFDIPIRRDIQLKKEEKEEVENLLNQVIKHWAALKNTTPDGLRFNYLMRDGKLIHKSEGWKLTIEKKTLDILMNQLPWGIGMVQLPWMQGLLRVEWN